MKLPIELLKQIDKYVNELDNEFSLTDRQVAIREAARLLVYLTHDEHYAQTDAFDQSYADIADACRAFVEA